MEIDSSEITEGNLFEFDFPNHLLINIETSDKLIQTSTDRNESKDGDGDIGSFWVTPDSVTKLNFTCPRCGRSFVGDWAGCHNHVKTRKHGKRCIYSTNSKNSSTNSSTSSSSSIIDETIDLLPSCLSEHSMLPIDEHSGWCELQGRKRYMEDMHSLAFEESYKLFAVFDGHSGSKAALFASKRLHTLFDLYLTSPEYSILNSNDSEIRQRQLDQLSRINSDLIDPGSLSLKLLREDYDGVLSSPISGDNEWLIYEEEITKMKITEHDSSITEKSEEKTVEADRNRCSDTKFDSDHGSDTHIKSGNNKISVRHGMMAMKDAFLQTDVDLGSTMTQQDQSGTTASVAVLFKDHLLIANVGDSRVVLCCSTTFSAINGKNVISLPLQLTIDHTPYDSFERLAVEKRGGKILTDGVLRVNGKLAVTRSLGDFALKKFLSAEPDVIVLRLRAIISHVTKDDNKDISISNDNLRNDDFGGNDKYSIRDDIPIRSNCTSPIVTPQYQNFSTLITSTPTESEVEESESTVSKETMGMSESFHCTKYQNKINELCGLSDRRATGDSSISYLEPLFLILASGDLLISYFTYLVPSFLCQYGNVVIFFTYLISPFVLITIKFCLKYNFMIDGLWDFLSGTDATELVCEFLLQQIITNRNEHLNTDNSIDKIQYIATGQYKIESDEEVKRNFNIDYKYGRQNHENGKINDDIKERMDRQNLSERGCRRSMLHHSAMHDAARLLAIEAYVRGSMDNVGVCVVDLLPYL